MYLIKCNVASGLFQEPFKPGNKAKVNQGMCIYYLKFTMGCTMFSRVEPERKRMKDKTTQMYSMLLYLIS
jgi:hypothetical protein